MALHAEKKRIFVPTKQCRTTNPNADQITNKQLLFIFIRQQQSVLKKDWLKNVAPFTYLRPKMLSVRVNNVDKITLAQVRSSSQSPVNQQNFVRDNRF